MTGFQGISSPGTLAPGLAPALFSHLRVHHLSHLIYRTLTLMSGRSRVTLVLVMVPSPSHGPLTCPGHPYPHHLDKFFILVGTFRPKEEQSPPSPVYSLPFLFEKYPFPSPTPEHPVNLFLLLIDKAKTNKKTYM